MNNVKANLFITNYITGNNPKFFKELTDDEAIAITLLNTKDMVIINNVSYEILYKEFDFDKNILNVLLNNYFLSDEKKEKLIKE